jgi:ABC-type xylose transport system permease subunit
LLVLLVLLIIVFSLLKPDTFLTYFNIRSILSNKSVQALVALSVFVPMVANQFDLSAGFNVGISQVLAPRCRLWARPARPAIRSPFSSRGGRRAAKSLSRLATWCIVF